MKKSTGSVVDSPNDDHGHQFTINRRGEGRLARRVHGLQMRKESRWRQIGHRKIKLVQVLLISEMILFETKNEV